MLAWMHVLDDEPHAPHVAIFFKNTHVFKVEQKIVESTQNASVRNRKRQPQFLETSRLESARSLHTERTHSRAKETAETA